MTTTVAFLSVPTPHQLSLSHLGYNGKPILLLPLPKSSVIKQIPQSTSSSSSSSVIVEEESPLPPSESAATQDLDGVPPTRGCKACGREEVEKGCNGEGRIQGGIATVPGFGWWPIKAYRPCPGFVASGGRYRRRGQSMDEVAFGRGEK